MFNQLCEAVGVFEKPPHVQVDENLANVCGLSAPWLITLRWSCCLAYESKACAPTHCSNVGQPIECGPSTGYLSQLGMISWPIHGELALLLVSKTTVSSSI